jgi:hypothetical protein
LLLVVVTCMHTELHWTVVEDPPGSLRVFDWLHCNCYALMMGCMITVPALYPDATKRQAAGHQPPPQVYSRVCHSVCCILQAKQQVAERNSRVDRTEALLEWHKVCKAIVMVQALKCS